MERVLARDLEEYCEANTAPTCIPDDLQLFFSASPESVPLKQYIERLVEYAGCSQSAFVITLVFLHRAQVNRRDLALTHSNSHRLVAAALYLGIKYIDDIVYSSDHYAAVFGITIDELLDLEKLLLQVLRWDLFVSPTTFAIYDNGLRNCPDDIDTE